MIWVKWGCLIMFLGVVLGAFGAHGLKNVLTPESRQIYQTAVLYHLVHGLGLLVVGWLSSLKPMSHLIRVSGWSFIVGILLFSGSLYLLSITGIKKLGIITPLGGVAFLVGWFFLFLSVRRLS